MLLKKTEDLYLDLEGLEGIKSGLAESNSGEEFSNLKRVDVIIRMKEYSTSSEPVPVFNKQITFTEEIEEEEERKDLICFPLLKELRVERCPRLKALISQTSNQSGMHPPFSEMIFQNLRKLSVSRRESLKNLFPASIAKHLPQLEDLLIRWCGVEEIVSEGEGVEEQPVVFEFPKVSSLVVEDLRKHKCFYKGQHTILCPMLIKLSIGCATLLKIVGSEHHRVIQERKGNGEAVMLVEE
ncbi:hypothetical protein Golob_005049, partial [Gossypium lobatum]|nr:hypothetical protein [Gossypium lobatum]